MSKKSIALTGFTGHVGSYFFNKYKKKYNFINIKEDIRDIKKIKKKLKNKKINFFIHLAAINRSSDLKKKKIHQINYLSVKKIISQIDFDHFIFASTSHVYKPQDRIIKETDQTKPQNFYAMTKLKAENEIIKNLKNYSILRIFNIYGSKQRDGYIYKDLELKIIKNINLDIKNNYRDFVHVNDVARSINHIIKKKLKGIFNISSGKQKSFKQIVNHLLKKNNFKYSNTINFIKSNNKIVGSNSKIKKTGFKFLHTI